MKPSQLYADGFPNATIRIAVTDVAAEIPAANLTNAAGKRAVSALLTFESNNVRIAFGGSVPTQGANQLGHQIFANQSLRINNSKALSSLQFINDVNAADAFIQATIEFEA
jgi:predicted flavoprotein YhiN